ncbi:MAG: alpha-L-fucosidase [Lentisphaerae bacterium]|jgi:alpha-L-fucosidase|nr:alpha-L-fucosidase [Lentisphaerota bacterium]MBT5604292.1 alpha-L-fucosidase [Lentisphaerota bacterium]MBT7054472.1 alpha-L-fucosidase [Lentisphaerota bacterium]MBT7848732.1 alpha-L-fucosidase [Lentisphaerota bacterium]
MSAYLSRPEYEQKSAENRADRMAWWKDARFGMFIHYGVHSVLGRNEWAMAMENWSIEDYEQLAADFKPEPGCTRKWAALAKEAGMKYMVLTSRHHEGFSLWDSQTNPYNTVNCCPEGFDVVKEFVESCREFGLGVGLYFSLMDWHHPDSWRCAFDPDARERFQGFLRGMLGELLGGEYGKIDILWYDVSCPMESHEGWGSLQMNQMVRELQPDIIINNRSKLEEDFSTPEERLAAAEGSRGWESCMTFNRISWGRLDSAQAAPYSYNAQGILRMLQTVCSQDGNLLLNIGPDIAGDVPTEAVEPLKAVGKWLSANGDAAVYGALDRCSVHAASGTGAWTRRGNRLYFWQWIWCDQLIFGGFETKLKAIRTVPGGETVGFRQTDRQILVDPRPEPLRDPIANITVLELEFEEPPVHRRCSAYPQLHGGRASLEG